MRNNKLTLGAKISLTTALLAAILVVMAGYGFYAIAAIDGSFETTANKTAHRAVLIGGEAIRATVLSLPFTD